jgi:hypothetical protein
MTVHIEMKATHLVKALGNVTDNLPKQLGIVSWKVGKKLKSVVAKEVSSKIVVKQSEIKRKVKTKRVGKTATLVDVSESDKRFNLRHFKPKQTKKGTSWKITRGGKRTTVQGAFLGPKVGLMNRRWKGTPFIRTSLANSQSTIDKVGYGPSVVGVYQKHQLKGPTHKQATAELKKQLVARIKYLKLKQSGVI